MGSRTLCTHSNRYGRHIPQRTDAHWQTTGGRRTLCRTCRAQLCRKHNALGSTERQNENRNTCAYRQTFGTLRRDGSTARRERLPPVFILRTTQNAPTAALLDMQYQRGGTRNPTERGTRFAPFQRTNTKHRTTILSVYRDQTCNLPRQKYAPALP